MVCGVAFRRIKSSESDEYPVDGGGVCPVPVEGIDATGADAASKDEFLPPVALVARSWQGAPVSREAFEVL
jgi:hypothetical protein